MGHVIVDTPFGLQNYRDCALLDKISVLSEIDYGFQS